MLSIRSSGRLPGRFYAISISSFFFQLPRFMVQPVFALYLIEMGASLTEVGLILSIRSMLMLFLRIPLTLVTQRLGKGRMIKLAFLVQATTYMVYYLAPTYIWFFLIPFYQIIATGSFNQLALSEVTNAAPDTRQGDAIGQYMTYMHAGQIIGPLVASFLLRYIEYSGIFLVSALFPVIGFTLFMRAKFGESTDMAPEEPSEKVRNIGGLIALKEVLSVKDVRLLAIVRSSYSLSNSIFLTLFPVWAVTDIQLSSSMVALMFAVIGFADVVVRIPIGKLADKVGAKRIMFLTYILIIIDYAMVAYTRNFYLLSVWLFCYGALSGIRAVLEWTHLVSVVNPESKSLSMSFLFNCWDIGAMVGSILAGYLTIFLPYQTLLLLTALINVHNIPAIKAMKNVQKKDT